MINQNDKVNQVQGQITKLENKVTQLVNQFDEINHYERGGTIILGSLEHESLSENSAEVVRSIKDSPHINNTQHA